MRLSVIVKEMLAAGRSVIPIGKDKKPIIPKWKPFQTARADRATLEDWAGWPDRAGWAVITGVISGIVIIDFDGELGRALLERWGVRAHVRTPSGGFHVYVRHPGWFVKTHNAKSRKDAEVMPGLDVRGDGGYAGFNGRMENGNYTILRSLEDLVEIADVPEDIRRYCGLDAPPAEPVKPEPPADNPAPKVVPIKNSPSRVDTYALIDRALGMIGNTGRNDAGFWLALQLRDNGYSQSESEAALYDYQRRCPTTNTKGKVEPYSQAEARASVESAFSQSPREAWHQSAKPGTGTSGGGAPPAEPPKAPPDGGEDEENLPGINKTGRAIMAETPFLSSHGETPLWRFTSVLWRRSSNAELRHLAALKDGRLTSARRRSNIANYIRDMAFRFEIRWNQGIELCEIPFQNGVLNLTTMQIRGHRAYEDLCDWVVPCAYNPALECPLWIETLESLFLRPADEGSDADETAALREEARVQDGRDCIAMLQEYAGYLMMRAKPRWALILKGDPDTGKSLLLSILEQIVGLDACSNVSWEDVSDPRKLAPIAGKRLNILPEASEHGYIADRGFNALLGGDRLGIDKKWEDPELIAPEARHIMLCNELPQIRNYSGAVYKRLLGISMPRKLSLSEQDSRREERLIPELPAIAAWAVEGARRLWASGYRFTWAKSSRHMMRKYRTEENAMNEYITAYCTIDPDVICPREAIFDGFKMWSGRKEIRDSELRRMLKAAGFIIGEPEYYKPWGKTVRCVQGLTLSAGVGEPSSKKT